MPDHYFWLSDAQFARLQPLLPNKVRGVPRVDDRKVISGIIDVIRYGLMWRDAPGGTVRTRPSTSVSCAGARPVCSIVSSKPWPPTPLLPQPS